LFRPAIPEGLRAQKTAVESAKMKQRRHLSLQKEGRMKARNKMVALIEKHDVTCMGIVILHREDRSDLFPKAVVIFSCHCKNCL
jgi:hypothetical protein